MKFKIYALFILLFLTITGCSHSEEPLSEDLLKDYLTGPTPLETPIRQYGEDTGYIQMEDDLVVRILYPQGGLAALDKEMENWVTDTVSYYQNEAEGSSDDGDNAELTAEYNSYLVDNHIISVKITGLFDKPYLAHPVDIIATFHGDLKTGEVITLDDILLPGGRDILQGMVIKDADLNSNEIDEHLLDLWTLTDDGLEIILERGDYLPMSAGTATLKYSLEQLQSVLSLTAKEEPETTESQPTDSTENESVETETLPPTEEPEKEPAPLPAIDPDKPMVALTFDDGPSKHTDRLLDTFSEYGGKGTFFVIGNIIDNRPDTLKRIVADGHQIAGHSWDHRQLTKLNAKDLTDQIMATRAKIYETSGIDTSVIRPPYGSYNDEVKRVCKELGIVMINWSIDTLDWDHQNADKIYDIIMDEVCDGSIILCHDLYSTTVDAMEKVIPELIAQGYQLVTVEELLSHSDREVIPGNVYNRQ